MSGLFSSGSSSATQAPTYVGLQTQTSVSTLPVPFVRGRVMLAPNIIWCGDFNKTPVNNGRQGKAGGSESSTSYDYYAALIMALCGGPIQGIGAIWKGQSRYTLAQLGLTLFNGDWNQETWGWLAAKHPDQAMPYPGTALLVASNYPLGQSASLDNHNIEVIAALAGTGANGVDADPALVVQDFLTHPQDGIGFPAASIDLTTLLGASGDSSYQTYCRAMGICFSPCLTSTETGISILQRWLQMTNTGAVWSDGKLKFIPYGDEAVTGNGVTFVPATQIQFDLDETDFHVDQGESAVKISLTDPSDAYTVERLQIKDRANNYVNTPIEARDPAGVERFGERIDTGFTASEICDPAVAQIVGQLILQRGLYIRKFYQWRLSWEYGRLEPMDCVTLTVAAQHLNRVPVRITKVEADDKGLLTFTAEALPPGVATAARYPKQGLNPYTLNRNVPAAPVNTPVIFEPSADLSQSGAQMWIGVSGGVNGAVDPNWGGADVLVSTDNVEYAKVATIEAAACQGFLLADLPAFAGNGPDQVNQLLVDLAESGGELVNASPADAAAGRTLCWVDGEIIAYATATVTAPNEYAVTYLERGLYGTTPSLHKAGSQFLRLNDAVLHYDLPKQYVGSPLWLKFVSFNIFDAGFGDQSTAIAYTITPTGTGYFVAPPTNLAASQAVVSSSLGMRVDVTVTWTKSVTTWVTDYQVAYRMGAGAWTTFTTDGEARAVIQNVLDADYTIRVSAVGLGLTSEAAEIVWNVTTDSLELPAVTGLELTGQGNSTQFVGKDAHFEWRMNSSYGSSEALGGSNGNNFLDSWFAHYLVTVYDLAGNALRTETVTAPAYIYTFEKNASDAGGPHRSFRIEVVWTDKLNRVSAPASLVVNNPAPGFPTKIQTLSAFKTVSVKYQPPADLDYAGTLVFMATASFGGAVPSASALVYDGTDTLVNIPASAGQEYFLVLASYDSFGRAELNYTSEYTTTTALVQGTDIAQASITAQNLNGVLNSALIPLMTGLENPTSLESTIANVSNLTGGLAQLTGIVNPIAAGPTTPGSLANTIASLTTLGTEYSSISGSLSTLTATVNNNTATIINEQSVRAGADAANASAINALSVSVAGTYATNTALSTAIATAEAAATQQVNTLSVSISGSYATNTSLSNAIAGIGSASSAWLAQLNTNVNNNTANITSEATARSSGDAVNAASINALSASMVSGYATIGSLNTVATNANNSLASQVQAINAELAGNYATINSVNTATANLSSAMATSISSVSSTVGQQAATIQTQQQVINGVTATYALTANNDGLVSGFGLMSALIGGKPQSAFQVSADTFSVCAPGATAFALEVVNGVVSINAAHITDASITNAKIGTLAVDNANIAAGAATVAGSANIGAAIGTGGYVNVATIWVTLKSPATVVVVASWGVSYDAGYLNTNQQFYAEVQQSGAHYDSGPTLHTGVATTQTPSYMWATTLPAGTFALAFWWQADNSHVQILSGSMTVFASQK